MGKIAEYIHQDAPTFGIEVEFCTHDSEILSFTHIEVCTIKHGDFKWKIETDADYTLELVSPILVFESHKVANEFKRKLMAGLDYIVRKKPNLNTCVTMIEELIAESRTPFSYYVENKTPVQASRAGRLEIEHITKEKLIEELGYHNWDSDTDLRRVLGWKQKLNSMNDQELRMFLGQNVLLRPSEKHGGLPSSQLNLPMSLPSYVWYANHVKEAKAWYRLALSGTVDFQNEWKKKKKETMENYPHLIDNTAWKNQYLNDDYLEGQIDENVHIWHRYWFWLVTIRELTEQALADSYVDEWKWRNELKAIKANLLEVEINHPPDDWSSNIWESADSIFAKNELWLTYLQDEGSEKINKITITEDSHGLYGLLYVTIHKLITGAMGVLSEGGQLRLQEIIVGMKGEISPETAEACIPNAPFLKFHYALKDLTPMWFKGSLADVLASMGENKEELLMGLQKGLKILKDTNAIEDTLKENMAFLGRLYLFNEYYHTGNDYEWDEFREDLLPDIGGFVRQFEKGAKELFGALNNLLEDRGELKKGYKGHPANDNTFLNRENVPSWEGRWDTMKPPMKGKQVEFLVEHRNN